MNMNGQLGDYLSFEEVSIKTLRLILGLIDTKSSGILHQATLIIHEKACDKLGFDL